MRKGTWTTLAAVLALAPLAALAQPAPKPAPPPAGKPAAPAAAGPAKATAFKRPAITSWTLDNGLTVFYLGVHDAPVVTVQIFYHVGSKDEAPDRRGSAHMFEHMMFKGTQHVPPEEHARLVNEVGGQVNAFTQFDTTGYHNTLPKQHMSFAVQLEAERMRNLLFRKDMVDKEREVVKEEKRMRVDNNPVGKAFEQFVAMAFTTHSYAWSPAGFIEDLDRLTPEELKAFYDAYYQPNNAALVVVGDVTEDEVRAAAQKWFGAIPRGQAPPRPAAAKPEPPQKEMRRAVAEKAAQVGIVIAGYKIPAYKHKDSAALRVAASILSDGESSRLNQRIVRKDKIGVAAGGQLMQLEDPGLMLIFCAHLAPEESARCEKALVEEVEKLGKTPPSAKELAKAKNQLTARFVFGLQGVDGLANQIGLSWVMTGDGASWVSEYDALQAVTAADVARVVKTYLKRDQLTVMVVPPFAGGAP